VLKIVRKAKFVRFQAVCFDDDNSARALDLLQIAMLRGIGMFLIK
jgi:hypothetical protein